MKSSVYSQNKWSCQLPLHIASLPPTDVSRPCPEETMSTEKGSVSAFLQGLPKERHQLLPMGLWDTDVCLRGTKPLSCKHVSSPTGKPTELAAVVKHVHRCLQDWGQEQYISLNNHLEIKMFLHYWPELDSNHQPPGQRHLISEVFYTHIPLNAIRIFLIGD